MKANTTPEQLAVFYSQLSKAAKEEADYYRQQADAALLEAYREHGFDRKPIEINGEKIGTLSINYTTPGLIVTDEAAFIDFCMAHGGVCLKVMPDKDDIPVNFILDGTSVMYRAVDSDTGEITDIPVDFLKMQQREVKSTMLRTEKPFKERVQAAMQGMTKKMLPEAKND